MGAGGNGQDLTNALGKILRINPLDPALTPTSSDPVSDNGKYRVPAANSGPPDAVRYLMDRAGGQMRITGPVEACLVSTLIRALAKSKGRR